MEKRRDFFRAIAIAVFLLGFGLALLGTLAGSTTAIERVFVRAAPVALGFELLAWRNEAGLTAQKRHEQVIELLQATYKVQRMVASHQIRAKDAESDRHP